MECVCVCVRACTCTYVFDGDVGGEAGIGGRQGWFGKSDSIELKKVKIIPSLNATTLEASWVSSGRVKNWRNWRTLSYILAVQTVVLTAAEMVSHRFLLGMQDLSSHHRPAGSKSAFHKVSRWFMCTVKFEKPCLTRRDEVEEVERICLISTVYVTGACPVCQCAMDFRVGRFGLLSWCPVCLWRVPWLCRAPGSPYIQWG